MHLLDFIIFKMAAEISKWLSLKYVAGTFTDLDWNMILVSRFMLSRLGISIKALLSLYGCMLIYHSLLGLRVWGRMGWGGREWGWELTCHDCPGWGISHEATSRGRDLTIQD